MLPRKSVVYRNQMVREFDLDGALARRPGLLLVDEYAHTNVPGGRHPKRWQDIDELLGAGIDVWTTLNIQHLESLNDVVQKISKVRVRETVPDSVFDQADEIVLVDFPPDELLKRLAEGKVYVQDTAARAVEHFFKPQNLTALRELALRRAAERVDASLIERMQAQAIEGPWAAGERILACIGPDPISPAVIRTAKRLADLMDAPWMAVTVERPGASPDETARQRIDEAMELARSLGGDTQTLAGADVPAELLRFARFENVTQIVIGRSRGGYLNEILRRSLPHELVRRTQDIAIHVITREADAPAEAPRPRPASKVELPPFLYAGLAVAGALAIGEALIALTPIPNLSMVFMLAVLLIAVTFGVWPAIFASFLSFLVYNFFFIPPLYTFTIAEPFELLALVIFLIVAVISSALAGRVRQQATIAAKRMRAMRRLYEFTRRLSGLASLDAVAEGAAGEIHASLGRAVIVLLAQGDDLQLAAAWPPEDTLDAAATTAARWAYSHAEPAGADTGTLPTIPWYFIPLGIGAKTVGVIGVARGKEGPLDSEARALLDTLSEQTAAALERALLSREMVNAKTATETERVRNTLLASISHDFRTPLSSILGAATSLIAYGEKMPEAVTEGPARSDQDRSRRAGRDGAQSARHHPDRRRCARAPARLDRSARDRRTRRQRGAPARDSAGDRDPPAGQSAAGARRRRFGGAGDRQRRRQRHRPHAGGDPMVIDAAVHDDTIALSVTDNGPGIAEAAQAHVFDKFARAASGAAPTAVRAPGSASPLPKASWSRMAGRSGSKARPQTGVVRASRSPSPARFPPYEHPTPCPAGR